MQKLTYPNESQIGLETTELEIYFYAATSCLLPQKAGGIWEITTTISLSFLLTLKILLYENLVISLMLGTKKLLNLIKNQTKGFFEKLKKKKLR